MTEYSFTGSSEDGKGETGEAKLLPFLPIFLCRKKRARLLHTLQERDKLSSVIPE
jgi:hypothetical protein